MHARAWLRLSFLALALAVAPAFLAQVPAQARTAETQTKAETEVFDEVWRLVRDKFYDRNLKGLDWEAVGKKHRADYAAATTDAQRSAAINAMLAELKASHTRHYTKDETAYYELADIFSHALRRDLPKVFPGKTIDYAGIGMFTKTIDGKTFVSGAFPGFPADKAGLLLGDEIVAADGAPFEPVASFRGKAGKPVSLKVRRAADGPLIDVTVEPKKIEPDEGFEAALKDSARIIESERPAHRLHPRLVVRRRQLPGAARGGAGERQAQGRRRADLGSARRLGRRASALSQRVRTARAHAQADRPQRQLDIANFRWRKPVALLINGGTRSGKEVLAHGFKKYGYGPVIGERTAGALLAGTAFLLVGRKPAHSRGRGCALDGERHRRRRGRADDRGAVRHPLCGRQG